MSRRPALLRRTLATRLGLGFGMVLILMILVTAVAAAALRRNADLQADSARAIALQRVVQALMSEVAVDQVRTQAVIRSAGMPEVVDRFRPEMAKSSSDVQHLLEQLKASEAGSLASAAVGDLSTSRARYVFVRDSLLGLVERGQTIQASAAETSEYIPAAQAWTEAVRSLSTQVDARAQHALRAAVSLAERAVWIVAGLALFAVLVGAAWGWLVSRSIAAPIREAVELSEAIAKGDLRHRADVATVHAREGGEPGMLLKALAAMRSALIGISLETRRCARTVFDGSEQMARSAQTLSQRTDEQTRGVHATRTSVQSVVDDIGLTARKARDSQSHCAQLHDAAVAGRDAAVAASETIERVSRRTGDMTEVTALIESIAFQINILSLNAAVEAARAGPAGAGFAVVAAEVRALAARTTQSTVQIRTLIRGATTHITESVEIVTQVRTHLHDICGMVAEVADRAREISADTESQTVALGQATGVLTELAHTSASNAEIVSAAVQGCASLRAQADALLLSVSRLQVEST